ncbi:CvpA family protein [Pinibacter soli]|uniref:CvpA family protein n=1 Tax=Pinibacter soli TaxID=3044211 RepID=A0ABT6R7P2_9BACT|nr:CvpA family protein [Pinibacter soli]MDI3318441.1 CvpA family protein [Pinibacter soli]
MIIDILFIIILVFALYKGWRNGFVVAILSVVGLIIGLVAAMKLSAVTANYLKDSTNISLRWLPFISFLIVFIAVMLLIRLLASLITKTMEVVALGWANKLAGIILYAVVYTIALSVVLFYIQKVHIISDKTVEESHFYGFIQPLGPVAINGIGKVLPWFKDMFSQLESFFDNLAAKGAKAVIF